MNWPLQIRNRMVPSITAVLAVTAVAVSVVLAPSHRMSTDFFDSLRQGIQDRAQVDLFDDFSQGLDSWKGTEALANTWSYDSSGFIHPGPLALFQPTAGLTDYDLDTVVQIQEKAVGIAFRAISPHSYQVVKLVADGAGPMSSFAVERYAVIAGQPTRPTVTHYPEKFQSDTLYQVHLEVRGDMFSLYVQGKLVDYWSDSRLPAGGVGLFCSKGERARVSWIRVSRNADFQGRLCSWLTSLLQTQSPK